VRVGEKMFVITQDALTAYEKRTGFYGFGRFLIECGELAISSNPGECTQVTNMGIPLSKSKNVSSVIA